MIRSLLAIVVAVLLGMTASKFIEGMGLAAFPIADAPPGDLAAHNAALRSAPFGYKATLLAGWGVGAFVSAVTALLIGRRWAPLGWLGAGSILFLSLITLVGAPLGLWLWPSSVAITLVSGFLSLKLLGAVTKAPLENKKDDGLFS